MIVHAFSQCQCGCACMHAWVRACVCKHACVSACVHVCVRAAISLCVRLSVRPCVRACICYVRASVVRLCARSHTCRRLLARLHVEQPAAAACAPVSARVLTGARACVRVHALACVRCIACRQAGDMHGRSVWSLCGREASLVFVPHSIERLPPSINVYMHGCIYAYL